MIEVTQCAYNILYIIYLLYNICIIYNYVSMTYRISSYDCKNKKKILDSGKV